MKPKTFRQTLVALIVIWLSASGSAQRPAMALHSPVPQSPHVISEQMAERIKYSSQQFVYLDIGDEQAIRSADGTPKTLRLVSVTESADTVIGLQRSAQVLIEVAGQPFTLTSAPNVMPTRCAGLWLQADTTSAWLHLPRRVQFSVWDDGASFVDTELFCFPLPDYALFSHGTQAYNEPVHLGHRDGDPGGQRFYHNYGVDFAGFEGRQAVVSCIGGTVVQVQREVGTLSIRDDRGFILVYGHLDSIESALEVGTTVTRGQLVGRVGKRGASGNFSHLHVGSYLSETAMTAGQMNVNLNLYPWLVAAYRAESGVKLQAVARPHHTVRVGEQVTLDGSNSWSINGSIRSFRWRFHAGTQADGARVQHVYHQPGCYWAELQVQDAEGHVDRDYCRIKVFSDPVTEAGVPTLFVTRIPAGPVQVGEPVSFRIWPQGGAVESIRVAFGQERQLQDYRPYSTVTHAFEQPGLHAVTVSGTSEGQPVMQRAKVRVRHRP